MINRHTYHNFLGCATRVSRRDIDLDFTMPNVQLVRAILIYTTICSSFQWIEPLFFELLCRQTGRQTHS